MSGRRKDTDLIEHATEIRLRVEIRAGELLTEMERNTGAVGRDKKGQTRPITGIGRIDEPPTLADLGITWMQSAHWQRLAALSTEDRETKIAEAKRKVEA
jgi:hypothetical protein